MSCSHLERIGVLKPNLGRKCTCFKSDSVYQSIDHIKCTNTNVTTNITHKLSCFSQNVIYMGHCTICNLQYIGKVSEGKLGRRSMMKRHTEHRNAQKQL